MFICVPVSLYYSYTAKCIKFSLTHHFGIDIILLTPWNGPWEANQFSASEESPRMLWKTKVHLRSHQRIRPGPTLSTGAAFNVTHFESRITHLLYTAINTTEHG